jgi:HD-GYP domain-containing protein (c-di-GMP phosphodiesterase class II)
LNYKAVEELRSFTREQAQQIAELAIICKAMSTEHDHVKVLEMILTHARKFTNADAGSLYLINEERSALDFHVVHNDSLHNYMGGRSGNGIILPSVPLFDENNQPNYANVSAYAALSREVVNIPDVYNAEGFNFERVKKFDAITGYHSQSMLVIPMQNHEDEIIGVLQLINAIERDSGSRIPFQRDMVNLAEALASQAAVVLTQQQLINNLENLFDAFIKSIAVTIEEKSQYTGGHVERVAHLTMQLGKLINQSDTPPFSDIRLDYDEMNELRIAAWMHDVGKISTPEHIVDKASRLETIYDRIGLIRTRWQVIRLKRLLSAERAKLETVESRLDQQQLQAIDDACRQDLEVLDDELELIETLNESTEYTPDGKIEQLQAIAQKTYEMDDENHPYLLDDELRNLSIQKGTLTSEEREIINQHAWLTRRILGCLPWPRKLRGVPEIAAAHHEKLDGSGYPLGLTGEQISLQARILAVADIFEALSAKDRPYRKPMDVSQVIKILRFMVKDNHIDRDIVDLLIKSGLITDYYQQFLGQDIETADHFN